ncbi:hypothetical protein [Streptomyces sp. RTGN2]|uniref:hypothetical protein n=1 Tax=Streptomyces sp. RTGN2 TaxID=3016525 RepID=UPI0025573C81|nr:hypothetical protein [Streptomyces sp. RTGN2]
MINMQVRDETGEIVENGSSQLDWMRCLQHVDDDRFPFLGSLLPFADAMFNSRQTVKLRREIVDEAMRELLGIDAVGEIERLCLKVESGSHLYLWFLGD